ncbi:MAG: chemotaxis protein CheD [Bacteroidetes bacterium GWF2_33_38]|nr:MAG: chemotaxis protein CheD [Bacteroidetes bacterium GWF2_33_38]OFY92269.1 MAG: chemotaxis protein CheD [Bacteroidetes bacterium RIFOXYA2_FULL_33_7]
MYYSKEPYLITTVLGSCVSVCLWDPVLHYGGMNHYMLPLWNGQGLATPKYGNIAIKKLIDNMLALGCHKSSLVAKVFGGGEVIDTNISNFQIGERNIYMAKQMLEEERIKIVSSSVAGKLGRKIIFNTFDGSVKHKFIEKTQF